MNDSIRLVKIQLRQDSIAEVMKQRQLIRVRRMDSTRKAKKAARDNLRLQNKKFILRKKNREQIRDSIARASKQAAAKRKAYRKSLKKQGKKKVSTTKNKIEGKPKQKKKNTPQKKKDVVTKPKAINLKKERERIRDSIANESKKAATKRKADRKSLKKQGNKKVSTPKKKIEQKSKKKKKTTLPKKKDVVQKQKTITLKKERERIQDSITNESKKAAAIRKANRKSIKKQGKKKVSTPKKKIEKKSKQKTKKTPPKNQKVVPKQKTITLKKERERIRDSIANESKKAAAIRKDNRKALKKQSRKTKRKVNELNPEKDINKENAGNKKTEKLQIEKKEPEAKQANLVKNNNQTKQKVTSLYPKDNYRIRKSNRQSSLNELPDHKRTLFGFQFGPSVYIGDLGGNSKMEQNIWGNLNFKENTAFYGFSFTHLRKEAIGLRLSYVFGKIAGSDKNTYYKNTSDPAYSRFVRNLDFQSKISEGSLMLELHPLKFLSHRTKLHHSYLQPYFLVGAGVYTFNPQGSYFDPILDDNVWVDLQPLSTEGQGFAEYPDREVYKLRQFNIPYGIGLNYEISQSLQLGVEIVGRKLFTDYLDDASTNFIEPNLYSNYLSTENVELAKILNNKSKFIDAERAYKPGQQRGNPINNDLFFSISGRLIIKINRNRKKDNMPGTIFKYDDNEICE